jgi:hypothetical protein
MLGGRSFHADRCNVAQGSESLRLLRDGAYWPDVPALRWGSVQWSYRCLLAHFTSLHAQCILQLMQNDPNTLASSPVRFCSKYYSKTRKAITYKRIIEARSHNHFYRGKTKTIINSECVSVDLFIHDAKCMRRTILSSVACLVLRYFSTYPSKSTIRGFGGLGVSALTFGTQIRGFKSGRSRGIFQGEKILSTPSFGGEVKLSVPWCRFTACKRSLNATWKSGISGKIHRPFLAYIVPLLATRNSGETTSGESWNV